MMNCTNARFTYLKISGLVAAVFLSCTGHLKADNSTQDDYLRVYVAVHDADLLEKNQDYIGALIKDKIALAWLQKSAELDPMWQTALLEKKIKELKAKIAKLKPLAAKQFAIANAKTEPESNGFSPSPYVIWRDALQLQKSGDKWGALEQFVKYQTILEIFHQEDPKWEQSLVEQGLKEAQDQIDGTAKSIVEQDIKNGSKGSTVQ